MVSKFWIGLDQVQLSRATEEDLLLKRRIENLLARATPLSMGEDDQS